MRATCGAVISAWFLHPAAAGRGKLARFTAGDAAQVVEEAGIAAWPTALARTGSKQLGHISSVTFRRLLAQLPTRCPYVSCAYHRGRTTDCHAGSGSSGGSRRHIVRICEDRTGSR